MAGILNILGSELSSLGKLTAGTAMSLGEAANMVRKVPWYVALPGAAVVGAAIQASGRNPVQQVQNSYRPQFADNPSGYAGEGYTSSSQINRDLGAKGDLVFHLKNKNH